MLDCNTTPKPEGSTKNPARRVSERVINTVAISQDSGVGLCQHVGTDQKRTIRSSQQHTRICRRVLLVATGDATL